MNMVGSALTDAADTVRSDFDERFAGMRPRLIAIGISLAGPDAAEDIVQDTYLRGRSRIGQLRDPSAFDAWLARIAVNACYNHRRGLRRLVSDFSAFENRRSSTEARDVGLRELIERLPARDRTVVVLHYGHGYGLDEIAEFLDLTHTNVRSIVHRARKRLAAQWEESHA
jgi:RNA polymerase sigma-70 factor (ECF subfamily)